MYCRSEFFYASTEMKAFTPTVVASYILTTNDIVAYLFKDKQIGSLLKKINDKKNPADNFLKQQMN